MTTLPFYCILSQLRVVGTFDFYYVCMGILSAIFHVCLCITCGTGAIRDQNRVLDPLEVKLQIGVELPCGCWELNLGPLEEQSVFHLSSTFWGHIYLPFFKIE